MTQYQIYLDYFRVGHVKLKFGFELILPTKPFFLFRTNLVYSALLIVYPSDCVASRGSSEVLGQKSRS